MIDLQVDDYLDKIMLPTEERKILSLVCHKIVDTYTSLIGSVHLNHLWMAYAVMWKCWPISAFIQRSKML